MRGLVRKVPTFVVLAVAVAGGLVGAVYVVDLQPEIQVMHVNAGIVDCHPGDFYTLPRDDQYAFITSFRLVNTGAVAGFIEIYIAIDGDIVRAYTFLVQAGEDRIFYPSDDVRHNHSPADSFVYLQGCRASAVSHIVGRIWRA